MWRESGRGFVLMGAAALALAACSEASDGNIAARDETAATAAPFGDGAAPSNQAARAADPAEIPVSLPKIAYVFDYGFRLPGKNIPALEQKHADMCEAMGPSSCHIVSLSSNGEEGEYLTGKLELAVAADEARSFGAKLAEAATSAGGKQVSAKIEGEDLSKQMVDTEARLRSRIALRDRLMEVLSTRKGSVAELIEAERGVATVNEEIDQASSWLKEMKGRVAFSRVVVNYESSAPGAGSFLGPVRTAAGSLGSIYGLLAALAIVVLAVGGPIALLAWALRRLRRRFTPPQMLEA
jgi:hypothetical protein